jgi:hypothetical protein
MEYLNIDSKILNFINFMNDDNKDIAIPEPTKYIVSTKSAKCQIMSKIELSNMAFHVSKQILENIFLGKNTDYSIMGLETDNLIIRADPKYKSPFIKCMGNIIGSFNEEYYQKEFIENNTKNRNNNINCNDIILCNKPIETPTKEPKIHE